MAKLNVNGKPLDVKVDDDTPLLWVLREHLGLTGTKYGCGIAQCGACTVHIDGDVQRGPAPFAVGAVQATRQDRDHRGPVADGSHAVQKAWIHESTCRNAATASRARSWPPPRC
jgi:isoquinoline 1-oxidoreductase alpha subunit